MIGVISVERQGKENFLRKINNASAFSHGSLGSDNSITNAKYVKIGYEDVFLKI